MRWSRKQLKVALYRNSYMMFDNFGFICSIREMPSTADYERARAERHPQSLVRRLALWGQPKKRRRMDWQINRLWDNVQAELANSMLDFAIGFQNDGPPIILRQWRC